MTFLKVCLGCTVILLATSSSYAQTLICLAPTDQTDYTSPITEGGYDYLLTAALTDHYLKLNHVHMVDFPYSDSSETIVDALTLNAQVVGGAGEESLLFAFDKTWSFHLPMNYNLAADKKFSGRLFKFDTESDSYSVRHLNCHLEN
jgi:hypothetical protein